MRESAANNVDERTRSLRLIVGTPGDMSIWAYEHQSTPVELSDL